MRIPVSILFFIILFFALKSKAEGPLYKSKDVITQQEFDNVYQDIRNLRSSKQSSIFINVKDYGAKGDGTTDDTASISTAKSSSYGKVLYFPTGIYMTDPQILISSITIIGDGIDKTIIRSNYVSSVSDQGVFGTNKLAVSSITIRNLTIDINRSLNNGNTGLKGIYFGVNPYTLNANKSYAIILDSIRVTGSSQHNIQLSYTQSSKVTNCIIDDFWNFGIIFFRSGVNNVISGCTVQTSTAGVAGSYAITIDDKSTDSNNSDQGIYNVISNNIIDGHGAMDSGIDLEGSYQNVVSNNQIRNIRLWGIILSESGPSSVPDQLADMNVVQGNLIFGQSTSNASAASIRIQGSNNVIDGNIISNGTATAIWMIVPSSGTNDGNIISNNQISTNAASGIIINHANHLTLLNNSISNIASGYGIRLDAVSFASLGGQINSVNIVGNTVRNITGLGISVESGTNQIYGISISNNFISSCTSNGINIDGITSSCTAVGILNNQIMNWDLNSAGAIYAIKVASTTGSLSDVLIQGNQMTKTGSSGTTGLRVNSFIKNLSISDNKGFNLSSDFSDNSTAGSIVYDRGNSWDQKEFSGTTSPAAGTWAVGDIVWNSAPTAGGTIGWVCTTGGTPGTWKTFGAITP